MIGDLNRKVKMVVQSLAEANYYPERDEITVLSKHNFSGQRKKIVGAVSVIFIQNDNKSLINGKTGLYQSRSNWGQLQLTIIIRQLDKQVISTLKFTEY